MRSSNFHSAKEEVLSDPALMKNARYSDEFGLFDSVFHEVSDAILIVSVDLETQTPVIEDVNHQFELITGDVLNDLKERKFHTYFEAGKEGHIPTALSQAFLKRQSAIFTGKWVCRDGHKLDVEITLRPFSCKEDCSRFICVLRECDTDRQYRNEAARDIKRNLLAAMHHNFRTPLNGILGYSEVIMSEMLGPIEKEDYKNYARDIHGAGRNLLMLIDNLLDLKELETTEFELNEETFDLKDMMDKCLAEFEPDAEKNNIQLVSSFNMENGSANLNFLGDRERLSKVLISLLENSLKFTSEGDSIELAARIEQDGSLTLACNDNGAGMTAHQVAKAFSHDTHLANVYSNPTTGIGFGLAYVKKLIEQHDGDVSIVSGQNDGTQVILHLPAKRIIC